MSETPRRIRVAAVAVASVLAATATVAVLLRPDDGGSPGPAALGTTISSAPAAAPPPPAAITLPLEERDRGEPGADAIARMRMDLARATARAERSAKLLAAPLPTKVAYFNMLGCYHTDPDEPKYGNLAYQYGTCRARMPQQFSWLARQGISIAGIGEFQGKAWRVLAGINGGEWGIFPSRQSGPYGQNPVVWRSSEWSLVSAHEFRHGFYNCANRGTCKGSSSLVRLRHRKTNREVYVLNTHHTSDGGGGGRRAANRSMELGHINRMEASGIPVIYMGDFNEVGGAQGHIGRYLKPAFGGMGIDQIWGTSNLTFEGGHYDAAFRRWTDHSSGIAIATANIPGRDAR